MQPWKRPRIRHAGTRLLLIAVLLLPAGCKDDAPTSGPSGLPVVPMHIGKAAFNLEVAVTEASRNRGLMRRDSMPEDHGMIFVFPNEVQEGFWMKDTRIPLFILFLDHGGKIMSMAHMKPYDTGTTPSLHPYQYAIELNDDAETATGVKVGETLQIPSSVTQPTTRP